MDRNRLHQLEAKCVQENPPGCRAGCPVHVDVPTMLMAIKSQDYAKGFAIFARSVPFPRIISRICPHPCQQSCKRAEIDDPISINALEKFCVEEYDRLPASPVKSLPARGQNRKIAVIGGGLSSLTVAWELARKGFNVSVYEAAKQLGGNILSEGKDRLPLKAIEDDWALLQKNPFIEFNYLTTIGNHPAATVSFNDLCKGFDALYLGVGSNTLSKLNLGLEAGNGDSLIVDPQTLVTSNPQVFAGGSLLLGEAGKSPINSIYHGKKAATSIERFLQGASLTANRPQEGPYQTALYTSIQGVAPLPTYPLETFLSSLKDDPDKSLITSMTIKEAKRCLMCKCLECVKLCSYLDHYGSYPKKYVREIHNNLAIVMGRRHANVMINSCSLCGLCAEVCPKDLNMGEVCLQARRIMVSEGKMPPSAHDFALRDMLFSTSDLFALHRHQPGFNTSELLFFPGCQLSASSPHYVGRLYAFLREKIPSGVGLSLSCCGAPALWSGREDLFQDTLATLQNNWAELGNPKVVSGCPTCYSIFKNRLPHLETETIWTLLEKIGLPEKNGERIPPQKLAVHDACTTRYDSDLQDSTRNILQKLGHEIEELHNTRETTGCCGYGGLMIFAHKELARQVIQKRAGESKADYVAYCAMCRDHFAGQGKRAYHILDLLYGSACGDLAEKKGPGFSERHENRLRCKSSLLREVWGEEVEEEKPDFKLLMSESVRESLEEKLILTEDIMEVIRHSKDSGNVLQNKDNGRFIAYYKHHSVTYWVEYTEEKNEFTIHKAYSHRVVINE